MMRVCHLDTCPVGVATQNPELRERFTGKPEFVVDLLRVHRRGGPRATWPRSASARIDEAVGHAELLDAAAAVDALEGGGPRPDADAARARAARRRAAPHSTTAQDHGLEKALDNAADRRCARRRAASTASRCALELPVRNVNRTVGTMLGSRGDPAVRRRRACPTTPSTSRFTGSAGQSLRRVPAARASRCGWRATPTTTSARACPAGGSSCARRGTPRSPAEHNVIAGNVIAATARPAARSFLRGVVGERFCVRNSGATAVVEGVGRPRLRVHDRWPGRRARADRAQPRGRHVRRHRPTCWTCDPARVNPEMVDLEPLRPPRRRRGRLRDLVSRHAEETGSPVADGTARRLASTRRSAARVHQGHAARLQPGARGADAPRADPTSERADHGGGPWLTRRASSRTPRRDCPSRRPVDVRIHGLERGLRADGTPAAVERAGRPLHGLRHPVLPQRLPARATSSRSGTTSCCRGRLGRRPSSGCTRPTTSPSSPGGCARRRARRRACSASTSRPGDHQAGRGRDHRPGLGRRLRSPRSRRRA